MSSKDSIKKLKLELSCSVCFEIYKDPKVLSCSHEACSDCLKKCTKQKEVDEQGLLLVIECPLCRAATILGDKSVSQLQPAFKTNSMLVVYNDFVKSSNIKEGGKPSSITKEVCSAHPNQYLEFWCKDCEELICSHCDLENEKHEKHTRSLLSKEYQSYSDEIKKYFEHLEENSASLEDALKVADETEKALHVSHDEVKESLENTAKLLCDMILAKKEQCLNDVKEMVTDHSFKISEYKESVQTCHDEQLEFCKATRKEIEEEDPAKVVQQKRANIEKAETLLHNNPIVPISSLDAYARSKFVLDEVTSKMDAAMRVYLTDVCPSQCRVQLDTFNARVGNDVKLHLWTYTFNRKPSELPSRNICCKMLSRLNNICLGPTYTTVYLDWNFSTKAYEAQLKFKTKGLHKLTLEIEGEHVPGSPFYFHVRPQQCWKLPCCIDDIEIENCFDRFCALDNGKIVYTQPTSLNIVNQEGSLVKTIKDWSFSAISKYFGNKIFAVDRDTKSIFEIDLSEQEKKTECFFSRIYNIDKECISDIAVIQDDVYVLYNIESNRSWIPGSSNKFCVRVYSCFVDNSQNCKVRNFGEAGIGREQLNGPTSIFSGNTNIYVADTGNHRVQVYSSDGKWLHKIGSQGDECGYLFKPFSVAAYENIVVISDQYRISLFWSNTQDYITQLSYYGTPLIGAAITVNLSGVFYIASNKDNCLLLY